MNEEQSTLIDKINRCMRLLYVSADFNEIVDMLEQHPNKERADAIIKGVQHVQTAIENLVKDVLVGKEQDIPHPSWYNEAVEELRTTVAPSTEENKNE